MFLSEFFFFPSQNFPSGDDWTLLTYGRSDLDLKKNHFFILIEYGIENFRL